MGKSRNEATKCSGKAQLVKQIAAPSVLPSNVQKKAPEISTRRNKKPGLTQNVWGLAGNFNCYKRPLTRHKRDLVFFVDACVFYFGVSGPFTNLKSIRLFNCSKHLQDILCFKQHVVLFLFVCLFVWYAVST